MPEMKGSIRVNKIALVSNNIPYAIIFLNDRMLFKKTNSPFTQAQAYTLFVIVILTVLGASLGGHFYDWIGALVGAAIGGGVGRGIGIMIEKNYRKSEKQQDIQMEQLYRMSVDEILRMDKNNFEIPYDEIYAVKTEKNLFNLDKRPRIGVLTIEGKKKYKFDIAPNQNFEECQKLITSLLPDKIKLT